MWPSSAHLIGWRSCDTHNLSSKVSPAIRDDLFISFACSPKLIMHTSNFFSLLSSTNGSLKSFTTPEPCFATTCWHLRDEPQKDNYWQGEEAIVLPWYVVFAVTIIGDPQHQQSEQVWSDPTNPVCVQSTWVMRALQLLQQCCENGWHVSANYTWPLSFSWKHTCLTRRTIFNHWAAEFLFFHTSQLLCTGHMNVPCMCLLSLGSSTCNLLQRCFQPFCPNWWFNHTHP